MVLEADENHPSIWIFIVFIVPVDMVEAVHEVRYTTAFTDLW